MFYVMGRQDMEFQLGLWVRIKNSPCHGTLRSLDFILSQALNGPWSFCHGDLGLRPPCPRPWVALSWPLGSLRSNCPKLEFKKMLLMLPSFLPYPPIFFFWGLWMGVLITCQPLQCTYFLAYVCYLHTYLLAYLSSFPIYLSYQPTYSQKRPTYIPIHLPSVPT